MHASWSKHPLRKKERVSPSRMVYVGGMSTPTRARTLNNFVNSCDSRVYSRRARHPLLPLISDPGPRVTACQVLSTVCACFNFVLTLNGLSWPAREDISCRCNFVPPRTAALPRHAPLSLSFASAIYNGLIFRSIARRNCGGKCNIIVKSQN